MNRRVKGEGSVYLRGKIWWITYIQNGRKIFETSGSRYKQDAAELLRERLTQPVDKRYTVDDVLDLLIQDYEFRQKKGITKAVSHLKPVRQLLGHRKVADVKEETIDRYQRQRSKIVANGTINRECQLLGQALNKIAYPQRLISRPIIIRKLPEYNIRRDFFEPDEIEMIISYLPSYLKDYVRFAHITGWRKGEISSLTWNDVYLKSHMINLHPANSKTSEPRILTLTGELRNLIERRSQERLEGCPYVFHRRGKFIRDFRKAWYLASEKSGCKGRVFHALRRSAIRDMIRASVDTRVAMSVSGHKTRSTFDRYNITAERDIREALERT